MDLVLVMVLSGGFFPLDCARGRQDDKQGECNGSTNLKRPQRWTFGLSEDEDQQGGIHSIPDRLGKRIAAGILRFTQDDKQGTEDSRGLLRPPPASSQ